MDEDPEEAPVLLFDGVCNLCNGVVRFLIEHDPDGLFRFAPLQSPAGRERLERVGLPTESFSSFVLVEGDDSYTKSDAVLRVARRLGRPFSWLYHLRYVPRPLRDGVYDLVARSRYRVFGRRDECMVPSPDVESRFLARSIADPDAREDTA